MVLIYLSIQIKGLSLMHFGILFRHAKIADYEKAKAGRVNPRHRRWDRINISNKRHVTADTEGWSVEQRLNIHTKTDFIPLACSFVG